MSNDLTAKPNEDLPNLPQARVDRRDFIAGAAAAAGIAAGLVSMPFVVTRARAESSGSVRFGSLNDLSGNFAKADTPKHHAIQLAIKEINDGFTLVNGPTGPGGMGKAGDGMQKSTTSWFRPTTRASTVSRSN